MLSHAETVVPAIAWRTTGCLLHDVPTFVSLGFVSLSQLAAESLFLRKQLALYAERSVRRRRADDASRITLVVLARLIDWGAALTIVKPDTLIRWHRKGFRLFWRLKSRSCGRPALSVDVQRLITKMARANAREAKNDLPPNRSSSVGHPAKPPGRLKLTMPHQVVTVDDTKGQADQRSDHIVLKL